MVLAFPWRQLPLKYSLDRRGWEELKAPTLLLELNLRQEGFLPSLDDLGLGKKKKKNTGRNPKLWFISFFHFLPLPNADNYKQMLSSQQLSSKMNILLI